MKIEVLLAYAYCFACSPQPCSRKPTKIPQLHHYFIHVNRRVGCQQLHNSLNPKSMLFKGTHLHAKRCLFNPWQNATCVCADCRQLPSLVCAVCSPCMQHPVLQSCMWRGQCAGEQGWRGCLMHNCGYAVWQPMQERQGLLLCLCPALCFQVLLMFLRRHEQMVRVGRDLLLLYLWMSVINQGSIRITRSGWGI